MFLIAHLISFAIITVI